jgi:hypothetical protein
MHGMGFLARALVGLVLVSVLACGVLGIGAVAFQAGQSQGYAVGVAQSGGERVVPPPYGYHGPGMGMPLLVPLLCGGGLILVLGVPILLLAMCGARHRHGRSDFGHGGPWPCGKPPKDMPDEVREYLEQHGMDYQFCPPGPWMFRRSPWAYGHGPRGHWHGPWADEDVPDEVKQWFRQHFEQRFKSCPPQAEEPSEPSTEETPAATA